MDELSTDVLRRSETAANLRRALGAPPEGDVPAAFAALLRRLGEAETSRRGRGAAPEVRGAGARSAA